MIETNIPQCLRPDTETVRIVYSIARGRYLKKTKAKKKRAAKKAKKKLNGASAAASIMAKARWSKPDADKEQPRKAGKLGGRPKGSVAKDKPRCACGEMTLKRAKARGHKCSKKDDETLARQTRPG